ncbi:hypothetical protein PspLS_12152 [Pyricularia sp. CBS 133598]|nr:hypothetical protein PspLS_12152 [Pyricularia sp. CBS 133598]
MRVFFAKPIQIFFRKFTYGTGTPTGVPSPTSISEVHSHLSFQRFYHWLLTTPHLGYHLGPLCHVQTCIAL